MSFLGTFFIWALFPSFNCINPMHKTQYFNSRFLAINNTFMALTSSTVMAFWLSAILKNGKFNYFHIINATLSGGVMISG